MSSRWELIRQKANEVRAAYAARTSCHELILPLEDLVEQLWYLTAYSDPELGEDIYGELNSPCGTIRLNPALSEQERNFVIAHEIGHYILEDRPLSILYDTSSTLDPRGNITDEMHQVVRQYNRRERHETEANLFALELLVPADLLWIDITMSQVWTTQSLSQRYGVTEIIIQTQLNNIACLHPIYRKNVEPEKYRNIPVNQEQRNAVDSPTPALIIAGPGTGKTRSIVAKYCSLVANGVDPAQILTLTFSNKATEEMQQRIIINLLAIYPDVASRVEISTFHAWGLNILKQYGAIIGLPSHTQLYDTADIITLIARNLESFRFEEYRMLTTPLHYIPDLISTISRAKDELCDPDKYIHLAELEAVRIINDAEMNNIGKTTKTADKARQAARKKAAKLQETGRFYRDYEALLLKEGALDYGDLIAKTVHVLKNTYVLADIHAKYRHILVDESQDINHACIELLKLLDGGRGCIWSVGDPWQSIYGFRGASPALLGEFDTHFTNATKHYLTYNYRSNQQILDASHSIMESDSLYADRPALLSNIKPLFKNSVQEWVMDDEEQEAQQIALSIMQRVGGKYRHVFRRRARSWKRCDVHMVSMMARRKRWKLSDHAIICRTNNIAEYIARIMRRHNIPTDWSPNLFDEPVIKDILSICELTVSKKDKTILRALSSCDFWVADDDWFRISHIAHTHKIPFIEALYHDDIQHTLSMSGIEILNSLQNVMEMLDKSGDAWSTAMDYIWQHSRAMRKRLSDAVNGNLHSRAELSAIGQLIEMIAKFVRRAPLYKRSIRDFLAYHSLLVQNDLDTPYYQYSSYGVRLLTIHKSKGLEFPIVYVPSIQKDVFPFNNHSNQVPILSSILHNKERNELVEETYVLFVAMTRAQHKLILTHTSNRKKKLGERSILLPDSSKWDISKRHPKNYGVPVTGVLHRNHPVMDTYLLPMSSLDTYEKCQRQFLYQYGYQLFNETNPYLKMHAAIRETINNLHIAAKEGKLPKDESVVSDMITSSLQKRYILNEAYADYYLDEAKAHIINIYQQMKNDLYGNIDINQSFILDMDNGSINIRVDKIENVNGEFIWTRMRSGKPKDDHTSELRIKIYGIAYYNIYKVLPKIHIYYTATNETKEIQINQKKLDKFKEDVEDILLSIRKQYWEPNRGHECKKCAFSLLCPL